MDEFNTIQDLRAFDNKIFNALQDYCDDCAQIHFC